MEHIESKVTQVADYYPFGMQIKPTSTDVTNPLANKYLYNGKELQSELGLDWYDYGARMLDSEIGRWWVIDPASESYYSLAPYHYVRNNPLALYDLNGMYDQALLDQWEREDLEQNGFDFGATRIKSNYNKSGNNYKETLFAFYQAMKYYGEYEGKVDFKFNFKEEMDRRVYNPWDQLQEEDFATNVPETPTVDTNDLKEVEYAEHEFQIEGKSYGKVKFRIQKSIDKNQNYIRWGSWEYAYTTNNGLDPQLSKPGWRVHFGNYDFRKQGYIEFSNKSLMKNFIMDTFDSERIRTFKHYFKKHFKDPNDLQLRKYNEYLKKQFTPNHKIKMQ